MYVSVSKRIFKNVLYLCIEFTDQQFFQVISLSYISNYNSLGVYQR